MFSESEKMEETIWILVGIISVLITIGVLFGFIRNNQLEDKKLSVDQSLGDLMLMCNKMCKMPDDTYLPINARLSSDSVLTASQDFICIEFFGKKSCRRCDCQFTQDYTLNLSTPEAAKMFSSHNYQCFFLKNAEKFTVECKG